MAKIGAGRVLAVLLTGGLSVTPLYAGPLGSGHADVGLPGIALGIDWTAAQLGDSLTFAAAYSALLPASKWDPAPEGCADLSPKVAAGGLTVWSRACSGGVYCSGHTQIVAVKASIWQEAKDGTRTEIVFLDKEFSPDLDGLPC